ncbi:MAG: four-carbon acid sugar kinase family protein [Paraglaciecola sp.]|uniref:four-carbon acid sugar kinase family protein n=1 Tax=Paraglaciecola sp. TaxID=1920173 RepID=UPI003299A647
MSLLYAYYGDDFTGSTDVLEQLAEGGIDAVLFLREPDKALRARFKDVQAIGIAGDSRSRSPQWMEDNLPSKFRALHDANIIHYKTCSTFDSSPEVGSIGKAMEIGIDLFGHPAAIVVAAPHLGRYVAFGNLFAKIGEDILRIDRHPTMSRHPVTPMFEADLIRHLQTQTRSAVSLFSLDKLKTDQIHATFDYAKTDSKAVLFDGVSMEDLRTTGALIVDNDIRFTVGSSGVTRALVSKWHEESRVNKKQTSGVVEEVKQLLVVSGSCSPVTAKQTSLANEKGYDAHLVDVSALLRGDVEEEQRLIELSLASITRGKSCIIHSADGPLDVSIEAAGDSLGKALGRITKAVILNTGLRRILFAGGDTSSHGVAQLDADAITWVAPIEVGAPLVRIHSQNEAIDGLEMVLKGGQMGGLNFFESVRCGRLIE